MVTPPFGTRGLAGLGSEQNIYIYIYIYIYLPAAIKGFIVGEILSSRFGCDASDAKPASPQKET